MAIFWQIRPGRQLSVLLARTQGLLKDFRRSNIFIPKNPSGAVPSFSAVCIGVIHINRITLQS